MNRNPTLTTKPLTAEELSPEVNLPVATINRLRRERKLSAIKLGYRLFRFDLETCRADLAKLTVKAL
jgi:hypothetical protein